MKGTMMLYVVRHCKCWLGWRWCWWQYLLHASAVRVGWWRLRQSWRPDLQHYSLHSKLQLNANRFSALLQVSKMHEYMFTHVRNSTVPLYFRIREVVHKKRGESMVFCFWTPSLIWQKCLPIGPCCSTLVFIWRVCFQGNWWNLQMCQQVSSESKSLID